MHAEDSRLEMQIALASGHIQCTDWPLVVNDKEASANDTAVLTPLAYAMFRYLVVDIAGNPDYWEDFLRDALEEVIMQYGSKS